MNLLDRMSLNKMSYDTGGYTVQEILSSFSKKILEIIDLVNKNEEVCNEAHTIIENIRNELVPPIVEDIIKDLQDNGYFDDLVNVTLYEQLRTELTTLLNNTITEYTTRLDNFDTQLEANNHKINELALDIRLFGQIGTDDDSTTFQNAINSKKLVSIPSGEYKIKQKLKGDTINFISMDGNEVKLYIDHEDNFFDMELGSGKHHLMENITIVKRNEFLRTGYGFNVLDDDIEVVGNLSLNRVFFYGFDIGINFKYMNWATLKRTMIQNCNIGIFLDGRNKIIQANNGNSFDVELMNNDIGLKISGDAVGNIFENIQVLKNKTGILIDEREMVLHGILNNTFNDLWLEFNTENDCKIYGGRGYLFNNVSHITADKPLFSNDSYLDNAKIINANGKIYETPIRGLTTENNFNYYKQNQLLKLSTGDTMTNNNKQFSLNNARNINTDTIFNQHFLNPCLQISNVKQNLLGFKTVSGVLTSNLITNLKDTKWGTPSNSGVLLNEQTDSNGGNTGFKFTGIASEIKGQLKLVNATKGRYFTFQILAKPVNPSETCLLTLKIEDGANLWKSEYRLNTHGWRLCFITVKCESDNLQWINFRIEVTNRSGILLDKPCVYEGEYCGLAQRGNEDGLNIGEYLKIENGRYIIYRDSTPTSGAWKQGDKIINTNPAAGKYEGWICTTSGTTGTWKGYNLIQS